MVDSFASRRESDELENDQLQTRERRARAAATFSMWDKRDGTFEGRFRLPEAQAEMLKAAIESIIAPRRTHLHQRDNDPDQAPDPLDRLDSAQRMGQGFLELCGHLPADRLPNTGGVGALLTVNLDYETLTEGIRAATLSTGTRISAGQTRRMACDLEILPQVFNGKSLPLDHGETKRCINRAEKRAMERRDGGCTFPGLGVPPHEARSGGGGPATAMVRTTPPQDRLGQRRQDHRPRRCPGLLLPPPRPPRPELARQNQPHRQPHRIHATRRHLATQSPTGRPAGGAPTRWRP